MDLTATTPGAGGTSTTVATRDHVYCLELAKRSVARAALHLGIPSMTNDVLNVLGDVLCEYLQRLSAVLAQNVESSGRSSQHVNALDALRAVELCTSPAVSRVHFTSSGTATETNTGVTSAGVTNHNNNNNNNTAMNSTEENNNGANGTNSPHNGTNSNNNNNQSSNPGHSHPPGSWQGLAAFCFGPTWHEQEEKELEVAELQGAGGKVGPKAVNQQEEAAKDCQEGWRAPFPDEVLPFPQCSQTSVSNPHAMSQSQVLTALYGKQAPPENPTDLLRGPNLITSDGADLERQGMESSLQAMPEAVWGGLNSSNSAAASTAAGKTEQAKSSSDETGNGGKRKLEEDENKKDDTAKKEEESGGDKMDTSDDKTAKDKEEAPGQPPKKKVKLEDGSAKTAKTATPKKKKKDSKEDDKKKDAVGDDKEDSREESSAKANHPKGPTGPTHNYVPTFFPPIPVLASGADAAKLRKTTVVDLLEQQAASAADAEASNATNNKSFGLRSALVQLGTSYWGSQADAEAAADDAFVVPVGRSSAPPSAQLPIVPLGRASGSRVSRILEGSMDAATMQQ